MLIIDRLKAKFHRSRRFVKATSIWGENLTMKQGLLWNPQRIHRVSNANQKLVKLLEECWTIFNRRPQQYPSHIEKLLKEEPILFSLGLTRLKGWHNLRSKYIRRLLRQAQQGIFPPPTRIYIPKPGSEEVRPLTIPCKAQRVRLKTLNILLRPYIITQPKEQHGFRPHYSCATCWEQLLTLLPQHNYIWEFDYRKFYDSITHTAIDLTLDNLGFSPNLIGELCPKVYTHQSKEITLTKGLLQGLPTSPWLSLATLQHFGAYRSPIYTYLGYADDGLLFGNGPPRPMLETLKDKICLAGLDLKDTATHLIKSPEHLAPFTFLGIKYDGHTLTLNPRSGKNTGLPITLETLRTLYSPKYSKWQLLDKETKQKYNYNLTTKTWELIPKPPRIHPPTQHLLPKYKGK
jgi:hypothetical protein